MAHTQQVVDHFEPLVTRGIVDRSDVGHLCEFGRGVVLEKVEDWKDSRGGNIDDQLVFPYRELLDVFGQAGKKILSIGVQ